MNEQQLFVFGRYLGEQLAWSELFGNVVGLAHVGWARTNICCEYGRIQNNPLSHRISMNQGIIDGYQQKYRDLVEYSWEDTAVV